VAPLSPNVRAIFDYVVLQEMNLIHTFHLIFNTFKVYGYVMWNYSSVFVVAIETGPVSFR
jgi:hypothetical protein